MNIWIGFITGLVGSLHCLGMCGPIALALPADNTSRNRMVLGRILYNMGRTVTYAVLGIGAGLVGFSINSIGSFQFLSILTGIIILLMAILPTRIIQNFFPFLNASSFPPALKNIFYKMLGNGSPWSLFVIGLLNGLLPCGLVYIALVAAAGMGSVSGSAIFMFLFGLGTFPAMFAVSLAGNLIGVKLRKKFNAVIPYFGIVLGLLFILRGLNLGIPYISPDKAKMTKMIEMKKTTKNLPNPEMKKPVKNSPKH